MKAVHHKLEQTAQEYHSPLLDELLALADPAETARTETRMVLATRIADAMQENGISKKELATQLGQHPSAITKWLSGKHNFTADTLTDIGRVLNIEFFVHDVKPENNILEFTLRFVIETPALKPNLYQRQTRATCY